MSDRDRTPTKAAIVQAQRAIWTRLGLSESEAHRCCWACGQCMAWAPAALERAHVKPRSEGANYEPGNFVLLCVVCHLEQPDWLDLDALTMWLVTHETVWQRLQRLAVLHVAEVAS